MKTGVFAFQCYKTVTSNSGFLRRALWLIVFGVLQACVWESAANQSITLQPGYNFVSCQINGTGGNDINNQLFLQVPATLSDPNGVKNATMYVWNCAAFSAYQYFTSADADTYFGTVGSPNGWYDAAGNLASGIFWNPGRGMVINNATPLAATINLIGATATPSYPPAGYCGCDHYSLLGNQSNNVSSYANIVGVAPVAGSQVFRYVPGQPIQPVASPNYTIYTFSGTGWTPTAPVLTNGEAAWFYVPCATNPCTSNLVVNGGFENPTINSFTYFVNGTVPGWFGYIGSCGGQAAPIELWGPADPITSPEGSQHLEISSTVANEAVCQTVTNLSPGCPTTVCFKYVGRPGVDSSTGLPYDNTFTFSLGGGMTMSVPISAPVYAPGTPAGGWQQFCTNFIPTSSTLTISFSRNPVHSTDIGGAHIDDVSLVQCCQTNSTNCCDNCVAPYPFSYTNTVMPGDNFFVNHLCQGTNNTLNAILPNVPDGTQLLPWNDSTQSFDPPQTYDSASGGWVDQNFNPCTNTLSPGQGFVIVNTSGASYPIVIRGCNPTCPPPCLPKTNGCVLVGRTGIGTATWTNLSSCPPVCGTEIRRWNVVTQSFDLYDFVNGAWSPQNPVLAVGESVFVCFVPNSNCCCDFVNGDFSQFVPINGTSNGWTSVNIATSNGGWNPTTGNPGGAFLLNNSGQTNSDPTISQTLCCFMPGNCYTIHGQRKVHVALNNVAPSFAVLIDGVRVLTLSAPSPVDFAWHDFLVTFTATSQCHTISFAAEIDGTDVSYYLDNVWIECTQGLQVICPTDKFVPCGSTWSWDLPLAGSCCGTNITIQSQGIITNGPCPLHITQGWVIIDNCGLATNCSQTIVMVDTNPPTLICGTNKTIPCGSSIVFDTPFVSDDCSGTNVTLTFTTSAGGNSCSNFTTRTWTAVDQCGNSNTCSQTVTMIAVAPIIICPTNKTIPCTSNLVFDMPVISSSCCGTNYSISIFGSDVTTNLDPCTTATTRTWLISACCGFSNFCSQTITVSPASSYTINLQPGYNLIANQLNNGNNSANILFPNGFGQRDGDELFIYHFTTNCMGGLTGYMFDSGSPSGFDDQNGIPIPAPILSPGGGAFYFNNSGAPETVTFTGTPNCTNSPPPLTCPCGTYYLWSRSVDCYGTFENITGLIPQEGAEVLRWNGTGYTIYTFTGGGWVPTTPVLNVGEAAFFMIPCPTNPCITLTCTTNKSVPCGSNWNFDPPTNVVDHCCTNYSVSISTLTNSTACSKAITRTWLYTDVCGHSNVCSQTVTLTDCCTNGSCCGTNAGARAINWIQLPHSGPPVLLPNPSGANAGGTWIITNLPCYGRVLVTQTFPNNNPTANGAYWSFWYLNTLLSSAPGPYGNFNFTQTGYGPYSWSAFNSLFAFYSANPASYQVNFYFLNGPPNPCTLYLGVAGLGSGSAATVSQPVVFRTEYDQLANGSAGAPSAYTTLNGIYGPAVAGSAGTLVGSAFSLNQFGSLVDTGLGVFQPTNAVALVTLPPGSGLDMNGNSYPATGTYACLSVSVNQAAYDGLGFTIGYVCCTNVSTNCFQVQCPTDKTVPCASNWNFDAPTNIVDLCCSNWSLSYLDSTNSLQCPLIVTRIWTISDVCGNSTHCTQTVTAIDTNPPTMTCATNKTVICGSTWSFDPPAVQDNCSSFSLTFKTVTNGVCPQVIVRTWTATDACGNSNTCSQTVTVIDTNPPTITCSSNKSVLCGTDWSFDAPTASDACCTNVTVSLVASNLISQNPCVWQGVWQAIDCCSNIATCTQTVTVLNAVLYQHTGNTSPTSLAEGWTSAISANTTVGPVIDSACGNTPAWSVLNNVAGESGIYSVVPTAGEVLMASNCWRLKVTLRVTHASDSPGGSMLCLYRDGNRSYQMHFGSETNGDAIVVLADDSGFDSTTGPRYTVLGGTNCNTFELVHSPGASGADLYINGTLTHTAWPGFALSSQPEVAWGDGSTRDLAPANPRNFSDANYSKVEFSICCCSTNPCSAPLSVNCATNKSVLCGASWSFDPPTATSPCCGTNVAVTIIESTTNGLCPRIFRRVWQITDCSMNTATCTQTVAVVSCIPPPANMVLWLPFDETSGTTSVNLAGGNNGTQINGPAVNLGNYVANSLCFNGVNQYVEVTDYPAINMGAGNLSVDAWIKPAALASNIRVIVDHRAETNVVVGYSFFLGGNNTLGFQIGDGLFINYPSSLAVPADGLWHHVAVTVNRSVTNGIHFFLDGVMDSLGRDPTPYSGSITPPPNYPLRVGSRSSTVSGLFAGCIDEVEVFNRELAPSDIQSLFTAAFAGKCKSPSLVCATNKVVQCDTNWSFDPPIVADPCGGANVTPIVISTVTNGTGHIIFTGGGTTASGTLSISAGAATSGSLDITAGSNIGSYTLSPGGGSNANFFWNGLIYPDADPFVDTAGLLFAGNGIQVNLFGNEPGSYSLLGAPPAYSPYVTNGTASLTICPMVITRTWLYVDACGHSNTCSQTVTVVDTTPPVITCPSNIVATVCSNTGVVVNFTVTATDNCCQKISIVSTPPSGSVFHPGTTTVTNTATDCCGNVSKCTFTVTVNVVNDGVPPIFTTYCTTSHIVIGGNNFASPIAASPSSNLLARLHAAGVVNFKNFDECTVNTYFAHTFTNLPPCITSATLTLRLKPCGDYCLNDSLGLSFTGPGGVLLSNSWGRYLGSGNPQVGLLPNNWCSYTGGQIITLNLAALPQVSGPALNFIPSLNANGFFDLTMQDDSGIDYAILDIVSCCCATNKSVPFGTPWTFDQPTAFDAVWGTNVAITSVTYTSSICPLVITRTWSATDPCGNTSTCSQTVTVGSPNPCQIFNTGMGGISGNIPLGVGATDPNFVLISGPSGTSCVVEGNLTGAWLPNSSTSQWVGPTVNTANSPAGLYHYQLTFILCCTNNAQMNGRVAVDDSAALYLNGNFTGSVLGYASFTPVSITSGFVPGINVLDVYVTNAVIYTGLRAELTNCAGGLYVSCPTNKVVDCGSKWAFDLPTASSCCGSNISIVVTANSISGICPKIATRTWRISDGCGNTNFCTQTVTLRDTTPPVVTCPTNKIIVALDANCMIHIPLIQPKASDNCTPFSQLIFTQNPPAGAAVPGPCATVTVTVSDACGNFAQCQVQVCGQDKTPPKVTGPKSITVTNCIVPNVLPFLTLGDNCTPVPLLHVTQSPPAGTPIAAGGNIVTVTVTDQAGNTTIYIISIVNSGPNSFLNVMFNSGVNASKVVLPNGNVDPHYTLGPVPVGTPTGAGNYNAPNAMVLGGFWGLPPFTISQWIDPGSQVNYYPVGYYTYTNKFTLPAGGNPATASISGRWAADDGAKMYLNGLAPANLVSTIPASYGFNHWTYFTIASGFLANPTVNTLYFVVSNSVYYGFSPTGLRVEYTNAVINCSTCTPPAISWITPNQSLPVNSANAVFNAMIWGTPPLTIQWYHNNTPLVNNAHTSGVNTPTLTITPVTFADAGTYYVCVSNPCGGLCSLQRKLNVTRGWWPWPWAWWNFTVVGNPMAATYGPDLMLVGTNYYGISSGLTEDYGLPEIGGQPAPIMHVPVLPADTFIQLPFVAPPESNSVSSYTLIADVYAQSNAPGPSTLFNIGSSGQDGVRALTATDDRIVLDGSIAGQPITLTSTFAMPTGMISRVAMVVDDSIDHGLDDGNASISLYINGEPAGSLTVTGTPHVPVLPIDYLLDVPATLFSKVPVSIPGSPPAGGATEGDNFVSSVQFHATAMTPEMIAGLGGPDTTPMPANDTSVSVQPTLLAAISNGIVNLTWTGSSFTLQETTDVTGGNWVDSTLPFDEVPSGDDITTTAHANPAGPAKFYRLIYSP